MTFSAPAITLGSRPTLVAAALLPLEALRLDKSVTEAVDLLPRSFSLAPRAPPRDPARLPGPRGLPSTREGVIAVDPNTRLAENSA